jgi:hypothetical protein
LFSARELLHRAFGQLRLLGRFGVARPLRPFGPQRNVCPGAAL